MTDNKRFFKCIRSRESARKTIDHLDEEGVKGVLRGKREIAKKLSEGESDKISHTRVTKEETLGFTDKLKIEPQQITSSSEGYRTGIVDLLTKICNLSLHSASVVEDLKLAN